MAAVTPVVALAERRTESLASLTSSGDMRRREKRLLQVAGLLLAALLFLPNVGLWSLYRDRAFYNSPNTDGPGGILPLQVRRARRLQLGFFLRLIHGCSSKTSKPNARCSLGSTAVLPSTSEGPARRGGWGWGGTEPHPGREAQRFGRRAAKRGVSAPVAG